MLFAGHFSETFKVRACVEADECVCRLLDACHGLALDMAGVASIVQPFLVFPISGPGVPLNKVPGKARFTVTESVAAPLTLQAQASGAMLST
eukprot:365528-Chlamydomonas_euryale.AAC.8